MNIQNSYSFPIFIEGVYLTNLFVIVFLFVFNSSFRGALVHDIKILIHFCVPIGLKFVIGRFGVV